MSSGNDSHGPKQKKWASRISRSRSTSSVPRPFAHGSSLATQSPRPSPPGINMPPSPSYRQHVTIDDGAELPPPSPSSNTISTTPKKSWERHYKSFLRGRKFSSDKLAAPDLESNNADEGPPPPSRFLFGGRKMTPTFSRKTFKMKHQRHDSLDERSSASSTDENHHSSLASMVNTVPLPDLSSSHKSSRSKSTGFLNPSTAQKQNDSGSDAAVRGGSLFSAVFKREKSGSCTPSTLGTTPDSDQSVGNNSHRRKAKSVDFLDSAVHRGYGKSYSPDNSRFKNALDISTVHHSHATGLEPRAPPPPPHLSQASHDVEGSVRGGVPRRASVSKSSGQSQDQLAVQESLLSQKLRKTQIVKSKEMKVAFTEFHNSAQFAQDSTSAYLGDEPSQHRNDHFAAAYNQRSSVAADPTVVTPLSSSDTTFTTRIYSESNIALALSPVTEDVVTLKASRVLCPLLGTDTWTSGRRYLVAPPALLMCPGQVLTRLMSTENQQRKDDGLFSEDATPQPSLPHVSAATCFGALVLGTATVARVGRSSTQQTDAESTLYGWSSCVLVLRQNYLLEYPEESSVHDLPRGFCHLEHSKCAAHDTFHDTLQLQFYASPCAKVDKRTLMIRVQSRQERDWWVSRLTAAAQLTIEDLYDFDSAVKFGNGRYANVYPARKKGHGYNAATDHDCAIKVIDKKEFWHGVQKGRERADTLVRETAVQAALSAKCGRLPTVLQLQGFFETCDNVVMELELLEGIDLFKYVSAKGFLQESEAACITRDLLVSLDAMQRVGVAHRDVKPANILMCNQQKDGVAVKIGDYGMSTLVGVDGLVRGRCGTPGYVAPEIFHAGVHGGYGNKVDVFSAGVTLYVMLCGYEPFYGESDAELTAANKEADVDFSDSDWGRVSSEAVDLVKRMLEADPAKRIDASAALAHPWITKHVRKAQWSETRNATEQKPLASKKLPSDSACTLS